MIIPVERSPTCQKSVADTLPTRELGITEPEFMLLLQQGLLKLPVTEADRGDPTNHRLARREPPGTGTQRLREWYGHPVPEGGAEPERFSGSVPSFLTWNWHRQQTIDPILDVFWNSAGSMFADYVLAVPV